MSADTPSRKNTGTAYMYTRRKSSPIERRLPFPGTSVPRWSLVDTRALRMLPSAPESSRNGGTSTSSAGYTRNDSKRFSMVMPAMTSMVPASTSTGSDSRAMRRRIGYFDRMLANSATQRHHRAEDRHDRRQPRDADQVGGEEQRRERDHVAGRGDDRRGHVVEVPVAADPDLGDEHGDPHHDQRRQEPADHRDHHEVGDRDRVLDPERDADRLGQERRARTTPTATSTTTRPGSGRRACCAGVDMRNVPVCTAVPRRLPRAPNTLPRMPMAAGTRTRRPGRLSRVPVIEPSVSPATRSPPELRRSA